MNTNNVEIVTMQRLYFKPGQIVEGFKFIKAYPNFYLWERVSEHADRRYRECFSPYELPTKPLYVNSID